MDIILGARRWVFLTVLLGLLYLPVGCVPTTQQPAEEAPVEPQATVPSSVPSGGGKLIDGFEDGDIKKAPEWWVFDNVVAAVGKGPAGRPGDTVAEEAGAGSLHLTGKAKDWYVGGLGTYLGLDGRPFNGIQIDIYGKGPGSGTLKVELVDDDNANWDAEQDPAKNYALLKDDKIICEIRVDWEGWRRMVIPFADFQDENPGIGDDIWNPVQASNSGGLLTLQIVGIGSRKAGDLDVWIDNIRLIKLAPEGEGTQP